MICKMLPKIGIFGTSDLSAAVLRKLLNLGFEVVGLWDSNSGNAARFSEKFDIPSTDSIDVLLKNSEVDLVCIFAPSNFQKEIITKALTAGKHIICEPPFGLTNVENALIMDQALYYPTLMMLASFGLRFLPGTQRAKELIKLGNIGKIQAFELSIHCGPEDDLKNLPYDWTCIRQLCAGPVFSLIPHVADFITFLSGKKAYSVCGTVKRFQENPSHFRYDQHLTREDFISWQMNLEGNVLCTCVINNNFPGTFEFSCVITGSSGSVTLSTSLHTDIPQSPSKHHRIPLAPPDTLAKDSDEGYNYRHPKLVISGFEILLEKLKEAFEGTSERRSWNPESLSQAANLFDAHYARAVAEAVKKSSENRRWTEVRIPVRKTEPENVNRESGSSFKLPPTR